MSQSAISCMAAPCPADLSAYGRRTGKCSRSAVLREAEPRRLKRPCFAKAESYPLARTVAFSTKRPLARSLYEGPLTGSAPGPACYPLARRGSFWGSFWDEFIGGSFPWRVPCLFREVAGADPWSGLKPDRKWARSGPCWRDWSTGTASSEMTASGSATELPGSSKFTHRLSIVSFNATPTNRMVEATILL